MKGDVTSPDRADAPPTLSSWLRGRTQGMMAAAGRALLRTGIAANTITVSGLVGSVVAAGLLANGEHRWGGLVLLLAAPADALDGALARAQGHPSPFGALLDSVCDRYGELAVFFGLVYHYLDTGDRLGVLLAFTAAAGSVMVSYAKARAEGLGFQAGVGLLTRLERMAILIIALLLNQVVAGLALIAMLANLTALQRLLHVRRTVAAAAGRDREG